MQPESLWAVLKKKDILGPGCSSFSHKAGKVVSKSEQNFTTLQLLSQWMASIHAMYIRKCTVENPSIEASTTPPEGKRPATQGTKTQMSDPAHKGQQISARNQHNYGRTSSQSFHALFQLVHMLIR